MLNAPKPPAEPAAAIDVVLTYVDGTKSNFQRDYRRLFSHDPIPCHSRSLGELPFILRSIVKAVPTLRTLYLIVHDDQQVPNWLDRSKLRIICHGQILQEEQLPCFNPHMIFANLHRIEGLAERYIIWSDDTFAYPSAQSFYSSKGSPLIFPFIHEALRPLDLNDGRFARRLHRNREALKEVMHSPHASFIPQTSHPLYVVPNHHPFPILKSWWREFLDDFKVHPGFAKTTRSQRRDDPNSEDGELAIMELWFAWAAQKKHRHSNWKTQLKFKLNRLQHRHGSRWFGRSQSRHYRVQNNPHRTKNDLQRLLAEKPHFFCINDEAYDRYQQGNIDYDPSVHTEVYHESLSYLLLTLNALFPAPCHFEHSYTDSHHNG